jgi:hypothetical protein
MWEALELLGLQGEERLSVSNVYMLPQLSKGEPVISLVVGHPVFPLLRSLCDLFLSLFLGFLRFFASVLLAAFAASTAPLRPSFSPTRASLQALLQIVLVSWVFEVHVRLSSSSLQYL